MSFVCDPFIHLTYLLDAIPVTMETDEERKERKSHIEGEGEGGGCCCGQCSHRCRYNDHAQHVCGSSEVPHRAETVGS